jgi:hypothetical protein
VYHFEYRGLDIPKRLWVLGQLCMKCGDHKLFCVEAEELRPKKLTTVRRYGTDATQILASPASEDQHLISSRHFPQTSPPYAAHYIKMAPAPDDAKLIEEAKSVSKNDPTKAEALYKDVLSRSPGTAEAALRNYEAALLGLGELYRDNSKANELAELLKASRDTLSSFAKAKTAKLGTPFPHFGPAQISLIHQSANSSTTSKASPTHSLYKSNPQNPVSNGPLHKNAIFSAKTSKPASSNSI